MSGPRYRVFKNNDSGPSTGTSYQKYANGQTATQLTSTILGDTEFESMTDVVTPGFRRAMASGALVINPCIRVKSSSSRNGGGTAVFTDNNAGSRTGYTIVEYRWETPSVTQMAASVYGTSCPFPTLTMLDTDAVAKQAALASIIAPRIPLMEDFLELRSAVSMLRDPLEGLHDTLHTLNKGAMMADNSAKAWLYYRMAAMPFVNSIASIMEGSFFPTLDVLRKNVRLRATGIGSDYQQSSGTATSGVLSWQRSLSQDEKSRAVVYYKLARDRVPCFSETFGLSARHIPVGLWNTVKLSFMVDRFYNVSKAIQAAQVFTDPEIHLEGGCVSTFVTTTKQWQVTGRTPITGWTVNLTGDVCTELSSSVVRRVWTPSVTDAKPVLHVPGLVSNSEKVADLAALILQRLSKLHLRPRL